MAMVSASTAGPTPPRKWAARSRRAATGPGKGAEFTLELTHGSSESEGRGAGNHSENMKSGDIKPNHRILVIDDNTSIHADFRKILCPENSRKASLNKMGAALFDDAEPAVETLGFELDSAYQGQEGLEMVKKSLAENRPYAMAFVDVRMPPGWDGIETIARIWEVNPELQIVVCTAYSDYSWEEMRSKVGQPDSLLVLKKPFDNIEVQQLAHALTKKWSLNFQTAFSNGRIGASQQIACMFRGTFLQGVSRKPAAERASRAFPINASWM